jgi:hypothetical protein
MSEENAERLADHRGPFTDEIRERAARQPDRLRSG